MDMASAAGMGPDMAPDPGAALVHRDLLARRRYVLCRLTRRRHAEQDRSAGIPRRAAGDLSGAVLGDVLAGRANGGPGRARGVAGAARAGRAIPSGLADAVMDHV